jgi:hypothetical protein
MSAETGYPIAEVHRRCVELARENGIGNAVTVRHVEPWSLKARPGPESAPATPPTDIEHERIERTVHAMLTTHYRLGTPWPRAWRAALLAVHRRKLDSEPEHRRHYLNGGPT